jgi:hypothetical protein
VYKRRRHTPSVPEVITPTDNDIGGRKIRDTNMLKYTVTTDIPYTFVNIAK